MIWAKPEESAYLILVFYSQRQKKGPVRRLARWEQLLIITTEVLDPASYNNYIINLALITIHFTETICISILKQRRKQAPLPGKKWTELHSGLTAHSDLQYSDDIRHPRREEQRFRLIGWTVYFLMWTNSDGDISWRSSSFLSLNWHLLTISYLSIGMLWRNRGPPRPTHKNNICLVTTWT